MLLVLAVAMHLVDLPVTSKAGRALADNLHAPGFGFIAIAIWLLVRRTNAPMSSLVSTLAITVALAVVSEIAQIPGQRNASISDLGRDLLGIAGFLLLAVCSDAQLRRRLCRSYRVALTLIGLTLTSMALQPTAVNSRVLVARALAVPSIATFDAPWEAGIYRPLTQEGLARISPPDGWPVQNGFALAVELVPTRYSGLVIDTYPDWSDYESISFLAATLDGSSLTVEIRIHDALHDSTWGDRYNSKIVLTPSATRFRIPLTDLQDSIVERQFDLARVAQIVIYKVHATGDERLVFDDFRLEP